MLGLKVPLNLGHLGSGSLLHSAFLKLSDISVVPVSGLLAALYQLLLQLHKPTKFHPQS